MNKLSLAAFSLLATLNAMAGGPAKVTDINAAMAKAKAENKLLFLEFGREACQNCQALRAMIDKKEVSLPDTKFVYADVNCDDPATKQAFRSKFKVIGTTLPFVVVASPEGRQLATHSGAGTAQEYQKLLSSAEKKAGTKP